jgi:hypothetical protein
MTVIVRVVVLSHNYGQAGNDGGGNALADCEKKCLTKKTVKSFSLVTLVV